jgi:hypothetical protein
VAWSLPRRGGLVRVLLVRVPCHHEGIDRFQERIGTEHDQQAGIPMERHLAYHNKQYGLRWEDVTAYIDEYALGRKMTKAEVKRFVEKNILTIDRKNQKRR